ncbi:MAG TPA: nuclear transport factor 2 family protein [Vicinamibacteria bacterium]|nr:nuclear transport factor 2 family protein [Vicinamibacteria bacterium]
MGRAVIAVSGLLFAGALAAQAPPAGRDALPSVTLPPEIDRVLRDYERGWRSHDASALAALFTDDGFVLSNGRPPVRGRSSIAEAYARAGGELNLRPIAYATDGSLGHVIGVYSHGAGQPETGKFVLALKRDGERWRIAADMDNANQREARPAPPPSSAVR